MTARLTFDIVTEGKRKKKNWLMPAMTMAKISPMVHERIVEDGMYGSSVFATADRTLKYHMLAI